MYIKGPWISTCVYIYVYIYFWSNYLVTSRTDRLGPQMVVIVREMGPLISVKSSLLKYYYSLARCLGFVEGCLLPRSWTASLTPEKKVVGRRSFPVGKVLVTFQGWTVQFWGGILNSLEFFREGCEIWRTYYFVQNVWESQPETETYEEISIVCRCIGLIGVTRLSSFFKTLDAVSIMF